VPLGWDAERVEASVRRRFPKLGVSRTDPRATVLIGGPEVLRAGAGRFDAVGIVTLDALLGAPDFRGGERGFALLWAAAEAVKRDGRVVVQTTHADHYAVDAVRTGALGRFYKPELAFRAELGYPPFRRLCVVSVRGRSEPAAREALAACAAALAGAPELTVYPPAPRSATARSARWQLVLKGPADLPYRLAAPLARFLERPRRGGAVVEVEMDPV
jgi:primosomal protein N' (replication factor Y)